tara:strand:+ start:732 stop:953 length:222 start_codon:yes stop_codon:yes gene_type:complete
MEYSGDTNAHNAITKLAYNVKTSTHPNSLNNVGLGNVSIALNTAPSAPYVFKNVSPLVDNGFAFYNSNKTIFS